MLDEVQDWCCRFLNPNAVKTAKLPRDAALLLWMRAENIPWKHIQKVRRQIYAVPAPKKHRRRGGPSQIPGGNSKTSLINLHNRTLEHVARCLNQAGVEVRIAQLPIDAAEIPEPPRSMPQLIEDVIDQLKLASPVLQSALVAVVLSEQSPGGTKELREAKQYIDREIARRIAA